MIITECADLDGDRTYRHDTEGPDDIVVHARNHLTATSRRIPMAEGQLLLLGK